MLQLTQVRLTQKIATTLLCTTALAIVTSGCASQTRVSGNWHDKKAPGMPYSRVLIVGHTDNSESRLSFEDAVAYDLRTPDTIALVSLQLMRTNQDINQENIRKLVEEHQLDAIIVTHVTSMDVRAVESGGRTDVLEHQQSTGNPIVPQRREGTIFQWDYVEHEEPVYTKAEYTTVLTTEVYGTASGEHVYTVVSTSKKQESLAGVIDTMSDAIAAKLRADGVVR